MISSRLLKKSNSNKSLNPIDGVASGVDSEVLKRGALCWPSKKFLGFRWFKKAKITLETISFWQNISISIFKFSLFLCTMKACPWNLINFSKSANALIWKERKKQLFSSQWEKKKLRKIEPCCITGSFIKPFNIIINQFFISQTLRSQVFEYKISEGKLGTANS